MKSDTIEGKQLKNIDTPDDSDVLSGRGNFVNYHPGNLMFRELVQQHKFAYVACPKPQKSGFAELIVAELRGLEARFLSRDEKTKLWYDIGDKKALMKTRQALREGAPDIADRLVEPRAPAASTSKSDSDSKQQPQPEESTPSPATFPKLSSENPNKKFKVESSLSSVPNAMAPQPQMLSRQQTRQFEPQNSNVLSEVAELDYQALNVLSDMATIRALPPGYAAAAAAMYTPRAAGVPPGMQYGLPAAAPAPFGLAAGQAPHALLLASQDPRVVAAEARLAAAEARLVAAVDPRLFGTNGWAGAGPATALTSMYPGAAMSRLTPSTAASLALLQQQAARTHVTGTHHQQPHVLSQKASSTPSTTSQSSNV